MSFAFAWRHARREARATGRQIGIYGAAVTVGVAALVAIHGFRADVARALRGESRALLGADLELTSRQPFPDTVRALLDSLAGAGVPVSYVTSFGSMARVSGTDAVRLVEVRAVTGGYPFYGSIETNPAGRYATLPLGRRAVVDPALLVQVGAALGDTLAIGEATFVVDAVLTRVPGEVGVRTAFGPRVYIAGRYLEATGLLRFGSIARHAAYLKFDDSAQLQRFLNHHLHVLEAARVRHDTAAEREDELTDALDLFARYLGLMGLLALLLGGVGVGSAVHVFVREKLDTIAVLRCVGATRITVFTAYLVQAALLGLAGASAGVLLGATAQLALPILLRDLLPLDVEPAVEARTIVAGLGVGTGVALIFALLPLLTVRRVPPLRALRRDVEPTVPRDPYRRLALGALLAGVVMLAQWQAPSRVIGLGFAAGVVATTAALWLLAGALMVAARRAFPREAPYVVRQGVANLFRPHNQTRGVTLSVGFGVFLLGIVHAVERNLMDQFALDTRPDRPNLVAFDIQRDQLGDVLEHLRQRGAPVLSTTPIVPARLHAVKGRAVGSILSDSAVRHRWPLTREYRHTYRDTLVASEVLVAGQWWRRQGVAEADRGEEDRVARISVEEDLAAELGVGVGDHLTWDVQGVLVETRITSLRRVEWARFEPNFFVVFEPGYLDEAPHSYVALTRVVHDTVRATLVGDLVRRFPNVVTLDLTHVVETLDRLVGTVSLGVRFMALFSLVCGAIVLVGAAATSSYQRMRESALLRTLGARSPQVRRILVTEYAVLGVLAGLTGAVFAAAGGWALIRFVFDLRFRVPAAGLAGLAAAAVLLTVAVGILNTRSVLRRTPLAVLRETAE